MTRNTFEAKGQVTKERKQTGVEPVVEKKTRSATGRKGPIAERKKGTKVQILGQSKTIQELENHIFAATRVRVVIRVPNGHEVFIDAEKELNKVLTMETTVAVWKDFIQKIFNGKLKVGRRGHDDIVELSRTDIVFIRPSGNIADGRSLIANVQFPEV